MRGLLAVLLSMSFAVLTATPAAATPDALDDTETPVHRDRIERPSDKTPSNADESEQITDRDMAALPKAFVQAARLGELGAACRWGATKDDRATARARLLWAAAAIARRVGVSPAHARLLIEAFTSDAEILAPIQADVASSVRDKHACEDDSLRETWEASTFPGSRRI